MTTTIYDVCGIGNAMLDLIAQIEENFIVQHNLTKAATLLIDQEKAEYLAKFLPPDIKKCSGGSVANTIAAIASLGGTPAYIGKVKQDEFGEIFRYDMRSIGVHFDTPMAVKGKATARCYVFVTPDAQRTMAPYIGACAEITVDDINDALIAHSKLVYVEGYLWDMPNAKEAIRKALRVARQYNRKVAFTLSDVFCVDRHRAEFLELIDSGQIDILFANEQELYSLTGSQDFTVAQETIRGKCEVVAITCSEKGSVVVTPEETIVIEAESNLSVIDTTGAGDLYASGFLFGLTQGWTLRKSGELATRCASQIIQQIGARPQVTLKNLL